MSKVEIHCLALTEARNRRPCFRGGRGFCKTDSQLGLMVVWANMATLVINVAILEAKLEAPLSMSQPCG